MSKLLEEARRMVQLTGALSNGQVASTLAKLLAKKRQLDIANAPEPARSSIGLPQGAIRDAVLEVLAAAPGAFRTKEIQARTVQRLGSPVSYDTVASYLSVACRADDVRVVRVGYGRYRLEIDGETRRTPDREASGPSSSIGGGRERSHDVA